MAAIPNAVLTKTACSTKSRTVGALVMGGDYRGLALVRSLGRRGIPVCVIRQGDQRLAAISRYATRTLFYPRWGGNEGVDYLLEVGRKYALDQWLLFPTSDESVRLMATHHERLKEQYQLTVPPWDTLQWAVDKRLMNELADETGVDHPRTYYAPNRDAIRSFDLQFPVILKPAARDQFNRLTVQKAWRLDSMEELLTRYDEACSFIAPERLMIQEVVPGGGESQFSYAALCKDGRSLASLVARRTRQFPMDFGRASTFVETIDDPGVVCPAERLLYAIRYTGLAEVEFKQDPRTGQFKLLDINPRVWGWYPLCARAGIDFTYLLWLMYQDESVPHVHACTGVRWVRLSTDFPIAIREILRGRLSIRAYLGSLAGAKESAIYASDDPWPGLMEFPLLLYLFAKRLCSGDGI